LEQTEERNMGENRCRVISDKKGNKVWNETLWEEMDVMSPVLRNRQKRKRNESFRKGLNGVPSMIWGERGKTFVERIVGDSSGYHFISHNGRQNRARKKYYGTHLCFRDIFTFLHQ